MIGGQGYDTDKYAKPGLTIENIFWMDVQPVKVANVNQNYFWRVLLKSDSITFSGKAERIPDVNPKYAILNTRVQHLIIPESHL